MRRNAIADDRVRRGMGLLLQQGQLCMRNGTAAMVWLAWSVCGMCAGENITCRLEQEVVQQFSDAVFPMVMAGKKRVSVQVLGASVSQDIPWKATITRPVITISADSQAFSADVKVDSVAASWQGKVNGRLVISYDEKRNAVVIHVADAIVPVTVGPITLEIDVSKEVPDLPFQVMVPEMSIPFRGKKIRVETRPHIEFEDSAIVVKTDVAFTAK